MVWNISGRVIRPTGPARRAYVARLTEGSYYMDGELHHMEIHGFAPYLDFSAKGNTPTRLTMELTSSKEPWRSLPAADGTVSVFEEQDDLLSLPAGETYHNTWQIKMR